MRTLDANLRLFLRPVYLRVFNGFVRVFLDLLGLRRAGFPVLVSLNKPVSGAHPQTSQNQVAHKRLNEDRANHRDQVEPKNPNSQRHDNNQNGQAGQQVQHIVTHDVTSLLQST